MAFNTIVVGVDGSDYGFEALRQALVLRPSGGTLHAITVVDDAAGVAAAIGSRAIAELNEVARTTRERARSMIEAAGADASCSVRLVHGNPARAVLTISREEGADLVVVGGPKRNRIVAIAFAEPLNTVLHGARCSVLHATIREGEAWEPRRIVVGLDGSPCSLSALAVAREIAERFGSPVATIAALGGKPIPTDGEWAFSVDTWAQGHPVDALDDASVTSDLVVVGSRGRHGIRALGSVGARVALRARCSVLLVRDGGTPMSTSS